MCNTLIPSLQSDASSCDDDSVKRSQNTAKHYVIYIYLTPPRATTTRLRERGRGLTESELEKKSQRRWCRREGRRQRQTREPLRLARGGVGGKRVRRGGGRGLRDSVGGTRREMRHEAWVYGYRVAKMRRMPYFFRSFFAKELYV